MLSQYDSWKQYTGRPTTGPTAQELSLRGAIVPYIELLLRERIFHGTFTPGNESSMELSLEQLFHGTFALNKKNLQHP